MNCAEVSKKYYTSSSYHTIMFYQIALLSPPYGLYTYALPWWWPKERTSFFCEGLRVAVPLGKGLRAGIVLRPGQAESGLDASIEIKEIAAPLEMRPLLSPAYLTMIGQLALRQCRSEGDILRHILPAGLRSAQGKIRTFVDGKAHLYALKSLMVPSAAFDTVQGTALAEALLQGTAQILPPKTDSALSELCVLRVDPPWPVRPMATKQVAILDYLLEKGSTNRRQLLRQLGQGAAPALQSLLRQGHVQLEAPQEDEDAVHTVLLPPPEPTFTLSHAQQEAVEAFSQALDTAKGTGKVQGHVLYGVTGSGKTAVYLELAKVCHGRGLSLLILAPEVALALKLKRDASLALPHIPTYLYHGYQNPALREKLFRELAECTQPCVVVGTRSALFLPLENIGAVVLDEEHDASFKQDEKMVYQAKEVAWFRMMQQRGLMVLGSATPDLKTFHAAQQGKLHLQALPARVGGGTLPEIRLVSIEGQKATQATLAHESEVALKEVLARGEQAVILLNRRGYAPLVYCLDCQKVARCPHCEIGLTYHKKREKLICHYCGYAVPFPTLCVHCKGMHFLPMGEGTEKLTEYLAALTSGKVLQLDRDSTRREGRMEEILEAFGRQEAQILVGTQMLSKGHHFPEVTLAIVADGDLGLNTPDYRAAERTFQLLVQSAGRAGRGQKAGKVLIQTRDVHHYCWQYIQNSDYEGFYADEMQRREKRRYPPFVHLGLIRISFPLDFSEGNDVLRQCGTQLRALGKESGVTVLGPTPAPLAILRGQRRFHCLLKSDSWQTIRQLYSFAQSILPTKDVKLSLDLDPLNMY